MFRAFIAFGSNISPADNVREALRRLARSETISGLSTVYRTPAEGRPEQADYYNGIVEIRTSTPPDALKFGVLRRIERELGRVRSADKFAARSIDLDLIWYGDLVVTNAGLTIPDPEIAERPYLALGLCELAPDLRMPDSGLRISEVAASQRQDGMTPLLSYGDWLRNEVVPAHETNPKRRAYLR